MERLTKYNKCTGKAILRKLPRYAEYDPIDRLAAYEDICFDADDKERITVEALSALVKAWDEGRVVEFPEVSESDRQSMADFLHDCFAEWIDDPSVGLYGMTEGEAALANTIMAALTRTEAARALGGGGDG